MHYGIWFPIVVFFGTQHVDSFEMIQKNITYYLIHDENISNKDIKYHFLQLLPSSSVIQYLGDQIYLFMIWCSIDKI